MGPQERQDYAQKRLEGVNEMLVSQATYLTHLETDYGFDLDAITTLWPHIQDVEQDGSAFYASQLGILGDALSGKPEFLIIPSLAEVDKTRIFVGSTKRSVVQLDVYRQPSLDDVAFVKGPDGKPYMVMTTSPVATLFSDGKSRPGSQPAALVEPKPLHDTKRHNSLEPLNNFLPLPVARPAYLAQATLLVVDKLLGLSPDAARPLPNNLDYGVLEGWFKRSLVSESK